MSKVIKKITIGAAIFAIISINTSGSVFASSKNYNIQQIESSMFNHLQKGDTSFNIDYYEDDALNLVNEAAKKDDYVAMSISRLEYRRNGDKSIINVTYRTTPAEEEYVDTETKSIINEIITPNMSEYNKIKAINEYLINRLEYDYSLKSDNAYMALTTGKSTCQGYAMEAYKLFKAAGIENKIITGTLLGEPHGWNLVKLNGNWYHVDVTNDDSTRDSNRFLLKNDETLRNEGFTWNSGDYPTTSQYNYVSNTNYENNINWQQKEGSWYLMDNSGYKYTGWQNVNNNWYYLGSDGKMQTGWIYDGSNWYYCYSSGVMAVNSTVNGYTLGANGVWLK